MTTAASAPPPWDVYPGAVLEVSADGVVVRSNGRLESEGTAPVVGRALADLLEPGSRSKWERACTADGQAARVLEIVFEGADSYALRTFILLRGPAPGGPWWLIEQADALRGPDLYETISAINADLAATQRELTRERTRLERALAKEAEARAAAEASRARLSLLERIGEAALRAPDVDALLRALSVRLREGLEVDTVNVLLADADGRTLRSRAAEGFPGGMLEDPLPLGEGDVGAAAAAQRTIALEDLASANLVRASLRGFLASLAATPIVAGERLLGLLEVGTFQRRRFSEDDLTLLRAAGDRLASTLERHRLWEAESAARAAAQAAVRQRDEVLAIVAHDLRNPLNRIQMGTALLAAMLPEGADRKPAELVTKAIRGMDRLIQDLLDVGRLESGSLVIERAPIDVAALLGDVCEQFQAAAAEAGIALECADVTSQRTVMADRSRLLRVFTNLLDNAMRVTARGGRIRLGASDDREFVAFRVEDTGPGIAAEHLPHLFDRFWQGTRERRGSAGLGLAIVKGIVEAHGGRVFVESAPGEGATFRFWIPAAPGPATRPLSA